MCASLSFADGVKFCSYVGYSSEDWTYPGDLGIYSFTDGARSAVYADEKFSDQEYAPTERCATGGVYVNGHYKYVQTTMGRYGVVASTSWVDLDLASKSFSKTQILGNSSNIMANIAYTEDYDDVTNCIYGYYQNSDYSSCTFGRRDVTTGEVTAIAQKQITERLVSVAVDGTGQVWGIDYGAALVKVDKQNGNATKVAQVSLMGQPSGMCFDKKTGRLYLLMAQQLFEVNKFTGELSRQWTLDGSYSLQGLFIAVAPAPDKAPAAVKDMTVDFGSAGSLEGCVRFTAPSATFDNTTPLQGDVSVRIQFNSDAETVNVPAGKEYVYHKTVAEAGQYNVSVCAFNEEGESPKAAASLYIGCDTPSAVTSLTVVKKNGKAVLSWDAPAAGEHGGYLPSDRVSYTIRRYAANGSSALIADNIKETAYTDEAFSPKELCGVQYEVTACTDGRAGAAAIGNKLVLGPALVPAVTLIHPNETDLDLFTQICADNNNGYWEYYAPAADRAAIYFYGTNANGNTDNWLISPPLHMEKGKVYRVSWTACNRLTPLWYPEELEVRVGRDATAEAMMAGKVLSERTVLKQDKEDGAFVENFIPDETGDYNIAFHDVTPQNSGYGSMIYDMAVGEGLAAGVPDMPAAISSSAHDKGELLADIVFMAPSQTNTGEALSGDKALTAVRILDADKKELYRLDGVSPGGIVSAMGLPARQGDNIYTVVAENTVGAGVPLQVSVYAGVGIPKISAEPTFSVEDGNAVVRWNKCDDVSADGKYVNAADVQYSVMVPMSDKDWKTLATLKTTEYRIPKSVVDMEDGAQGLLYFGVRPSNVAGKGAMKETNTMLAGRSYTTPWKESCTGGMTESFWMVDEYSIFNRSVWETSRMSSDADGGSYVFTPSVSSDGSADSCTVSFGKVDISRLTVPVLRFDTYFTPRSKAWIDVKVSQNCDIYDRKTVETVSMEESDKSGWHTVTVDLSGYKSADNIMLSFSGHSAKEPLYVDNIRVADYAGKNLAVQSLSAPVKVYSGDEATVSAVVSNEGRDAVADYEVRLYDGEKLLRVQQGKNLQPDETQAFDFKVMTDNNGGDYINARVEVACDGDEIPADNVSAEEKIRIVKAELAAPSNLSGVLTGDGSVRLSWNAPAERPAEPVDVEDSFEDLTPWSVRDFGEWTMIDGDGSPTSYLSGYDWPNAGKPHAAIVFAPYEIGIDNYMPAADGEKYLASFVGEKDCDDWLITPRLSGNAQTFSFMVSELGRYEGVSDEKFELLVSRTTNDIAAFERVGDVHTLDFAEPEWREVTLDVEEGVKYVAIHHTTAGGTALLVDLAKYQMAPLPFNYRFLGYNIYRNGEQQNVEPLTDTHCTVLADGGDYVYEVRAVYSIGTSEPSNSFAVSTLGVEQPSAGTEVDAAAGKHYDLSGRAVYGEKAKGVHVVKGKKFVVK